MYEIQHCYNNYKMSYIKLQFCIQLISFYDKLLLSVYNIHQFTVSYEILNVFRELNSVAYIDDNVF